MEDLIWAFSPFLSRLLVFDLVEAAMPLVGVKAEFIPLFSEAFSVKDRKYFQFHLYSVSNCNKIDLFTFANPNVSIFIIVTYF